MDSIDVPILFALSAISTIAVFAMSAAFAVSPFKPLSNEAEKLVTVSMY